MLRLKYALKLLHPFLFAFSSLISIYMFASVIASPDQMIRVLVFYWGVLVILVFPAYWIAKDLDWAGILLSVFAISFYSPPDIFRAQIIVIAAALLICFILLYIRKIPPKISHVLNSLNFSSGIFLLLVMSALLNHLSVVPFNDMPQYGWDNRALLPLSSPPDDLPDIYYIVLDGYGRADILDEYYGYDNSEFIEDLSERGFIIPSRARSNYPKTVLSISSTLNMEYASNLVPQLKDTNTYYWWLMRPLIMRSDVRRLLDDVGYRSYSTATGWGPTENPTTDIYYKPMPIVLSDLETAVLSETPLRMMSSVFSRFSYVPSFEAHHDLVLHNFSAVSTASRDRGAKFVFAHIVSPHPPFVFDENGELLTPDYNYSFNDASDIDITDEEYRAGYVEQIEFINKKILDLVDEIIRNSETPPIILLQADHGPGLMTDFSSSDNTCLKERFSIFAAYYLPGANEDVVPDDITPVNLFRIIFNTYFDASYPMLPNRQYYVEGVFLYNDKEVTSAVDTCSIK